MIRQIFIVRRHGSRMETALATAWGSTEHRHTARTHMFVAATLCWDEGWAPVHIRNMSSRGALIEAVVLPKPGIRVVLKRGSLEASGRIAWGASRQAGLAFETAVRVSDWMLRRANAHQDRLDEIVAALKSATTLNEQPLVADKVKAAPVAVDAELALLKADLAQLGNALATDIILVATHPEIQLIDIALQRVERISKSLSQA